MARKPGGERGREGVPASPEPPVLVVDPNPPPPATPRGARPSPADYQAAVSGHIPPVNGIVAQAIGAGLHVEPLLFAMMIVAANYVDAVANPVNGDALMEQLIGQLRATHALARQDSYRKMVAAAEEQARAQASAATPGLN